MKNSIVIMLIMSLPIWLASCGGGSTASSSAPGVSSGTITGFGSVFVNGVKFNTDNATVSRGGDIVDNVRDLEIGMVVQVQGDFQSSVADTVRFEEDVKGPADGAAVGGTFSVMGQTIITDAATFFNNTSLASIAAGDILEISGMRDANDDIVASFVEKKVNAAAVKRFSLIGNVRNLDTVAMTFNIDNLNVDYSAANVNDLIGGAPVDGQLVEIKDDLKAYVPASLTLAATKVEPQNPLGAGGVVGAKVEIESLVTEIISANEFKVGDLSILILDSTRFLFGSKDNIIVGSRLEVEGVLVAEGVLQASKIKFEDNDARIQARVDLGGVDTASNTLTLLGITVSITNQTDMEDKRDDVSSFSLADISSNDYLEIRGFIGANGAFIASELRRESDDKKVELRGPVSVKDEVASMVTILGVAVNIGGNTDIFGLSGNRISPTQFFASIVERLTVVKVKWDPFSDVSQSAKEVELED